MPNPMNPIQKLLPEKKFCSAHPNNGNAFFAYIAKDQECDGCKMNRAFNNAIDDCHSALDVVIDEAKCHEIWHKATGEEISLSIAKGIKALCHADIYKRRE